MTTIRAVFEAIDEFAPFSHQESWDNSGLLVGDPHTPVTKAVVTLDITKAVVKEAKDEGAQLIVSHHPVLFHPAKTFLSDSVPYQLAAAGIGAICAHTSLDLAAGGVNCCLANRLGLTDQRPFLRENTRFYRKLVVFCPHEYTNRIHSAMKEAGAGTLGDYAGCAFVSPGEGRFLPLDEAKPFLGKPGEWEYAKEDRLEMICPPSKVEAVLSAMRKAHPYEEPAFDVFETTALADSDSLGLIGCLDSEQQPEEFAGYVGECLRCGGLRYVPGQRPVKRVAVLGGAGGDTVTKAVALGVDALVTGEAKHHQLLEAMEAGLTLVDAGHFSTEDVVVEPLCSRLAARFPQVTFHKSAVCEDPARYWVSSR